MGPGQWSTTDATREINRCALSATLNLTYVKRLRDDLKECGLTMGDVLHVLKRGFVLDEPEASTRRGYFKYQIEATTPNSDGRTIILVVIPDGSCELNIKRLLWRDET